MSEGTYICQLFLSSLLHLFLSKIKMKLVFYVYFCFAAVTCFVVIRLKLISLETKSDSSQLLCKCALGHILFIESQKSNKHFMQRNNWQCFILLILFFFCAFLPRLCLLLSFVFICISLYFPFVFILWCDSNETATCTPDKIKWKKKNETKIRWNELFLWLFVLYSGANLIVTITSLCIRISNILLITNVIKYILMGNERVMSMIRLNIHLYKYMIC